MMNKTQTPAAHNVLRILTLLSSTGTPVSATRIQKELGLPRSSTYHLLKELENSGFVVHLSKRGTYGLGLAAYQMAQAYTTQQPLVRIAAKPLERIAESVGGSAHLSRLAGSEIVYLHEVRAAGSVSLVTEVGVRLSALHTASGRVMLAYLPEAELKAVFSSSGEQKRYRKIKDSLLKARERGWTEEQQEVSRGQESLAVAVLDHLSRPAAALAVTFALDSLGEKERSNLIRVLQEEATRLRSQFFQHA